MNARERVEAILRREPGGFRRLFVQAELLGPPLVRRRGRGRPPGLLPGPPATAGTGTLAAGPRDVRRAPGRDPGSGGT